jgi:hypothetical protein
MGLRSPKTGSTHLLIITCWNGWLIESAAIATHIDQKYAGFLKTKEKLITRI